MGIDSTDAAAKIDSALRRLGDVFGEGSDELAGQVADAMADAFEGFAPAHVLGAAEEYAKNPALAQKRPGWAHHSPLARAAFDWLVLYYTAKRTPSRLPDELAGCAQADTC